MFKNNLQSDSRTDKYGDYIIGQSHTLPELKQYTQEQAWDFLRTFDLTPKRTRLNMLNHYRNRLNYLRTLPSSVHPITINLLQDNIALLEATFEYTIWIQPNMNSRNSQITYYTDEEE